MSYRYFTEKEMACKCNRDDCTNLKMNRDFMESLDSLRGRCGFPFVISSAYRCPKHNQRVSSSGALGPHTTGRAVHILVAHEEAIRIIEECRAYGFTGIGVHQHGAGRYIHLDNLTESDGFHRPTIWTYG